MLLTALLPGTDLPENPSCTTQFVRRDSSSINPSDENFVQSSAEKTSKLGLIIFFSIWVGLLGGVTGFMVGGPVGAVVGAVVGAALGAGIGSRIKEGGVEPSNKLSVRNSPRTF